VGGEGEWEELGGRSRKRGIGEGLEKGKKGIPLYCIKI
jgi:hypothetical protein